MSNLTQAEEKAWKAYAAEWFDFDPSESDFIAGFRAALVASGVQPDQEWAELLEAHDDGWRAGVEAALAEFDIAVSYRPTGWPDHDQPALRERGFKEVRAAIAALAASGAQADRAAIVEEALREARHAIIRLAEDGTDRLRDAGVNVDPAERTYGPYVARIDAALAPDAQQEPQLSADTELLDALRATADMNKAGFTYPSINAALLRQAAARIEELETALRPFANAVFNDNGDVTYDHTQYGTDDLWRAYHTLRTLPPHPALASKETADG